MRKAGVPCPRWLKAPRSSGRLMVNQMFDAKRPLQKLRDVFFKHGVSRWPSASRLSWKLPAPELEWAGPPPLPIVARVVGFDKLILLTNPQSQAVHFSQRMALSRRARCTAGLGTAFLKGWQAKRSARKRSSCEPRPPVMLK